MECNLGPIRGKLYSEHPVKGRTVLSDSARPVFEIASAARRMVSHAQNREPHPTAREDPLKPETLLWIMFHYTMMNDRAVVDKALIYVPDRRAHAAELLSYLQGGGTWSLRTIHSLTPDEAVFKINTTMVTVRMLPVDHKDSAEGLKNFLRDKEFAVAFRVDAPPRCLVPQQDDLYYFQRHDSLFSLLKEQAPDDDRLVEATKMMSKVVDCLSQPPWSERRESGNQ